jgi:hypothetical protein
MQAKKDIGRKTGTTKRWRSDACQDRHFSWTRSAQRVF